MSKVKGITKLDELNTTTSEGKLLFAAIGLLSSNKDKEKVKHPDEIIMLLNDYSDPAMIGDRDKIHDYLFGV